LVLWPARARLVPSWKWKWLPRKEVRWMETILLLCMAFLLICATIFNNSANTKN